MNRKLSPTSRVLTNGNHIKVEKEDIEMLNRNVNTKWASKMRERERENHNYDEIDQLLGKTSDVKRGQKYKIIYCGL